MTPRTVKPKVEVIRDGKKSPMTKADANSPEKKPFNMVEYFKGVKQEWHKVTWPGRGEVLRETAVVLFVVALFSTFVFVVDKLFQAIIQIIT